MGGLAGVVDTQTSPEQMDILLSRMLQALKAEPWYESSARIVDGAAMGRASLGIFNPGPQPVPNETGTLWAAMEGEIYNTLYQPVRRDLLERGHRIQSDSDAELMLHLFEEYGEDFVRHINGSFNLAIWDSKERRLFVFRDRYGSRPFYYYRTETAFCFASEIKALLQDDRFRREVDEEGAIEFLTFRHLLGEKTLIAGIHWLPPATVLKYQDGQLTQHSYWMPPLERQDAQPSFSDSAEHLTYLLRQAVDRCMGGEHSIGLFLSGGVDSRLLAGTVDRRHLPFHTFTRGTPGCADARLGQAVAHQIGSTHHFIEIHPEYLVHQAKRGVWLTDGLMTCVDFYVLSSIEKVKQHVDVVWLGVPSGGLQGMGSRRAFLGLGDEQLAEEIYNMRAVYLQDWMQPRVFTEGFHKRIKGVVLRNVRQIVRDIPLERSYAKAHYYLFRHYGPRAGMHGPVLARSLVETRLPLADAELLDFIHTLPPEFTQGRKLEIEVLRRVNPELADIPWQFTGLPVSLSTPARTRFRRALNRAHKELSWRTYGLIPPPRGREQADYPIWFRTVLRSWLEGILLSERTLSRGYYRREGIAQLIDKHMSGRRDHSIQFGVLLTFELWNRLFIDQEAL
jgi:asparagine synthase (glutamine-hydrolysing)